MYRMLFEALKKVQMVKITPHEIPTTQQKKFSQNFPFPPTGGITLPFNAISKPLNCPFAPKEDFLRKIPNISITFVYLLFSIMRKCFIKNP